MEKEAESQSTKQWREYTAGRLREFQFQFANVRTALTEDSAQSALRQLARVNSLLQKLVDELDPPDVPRQSTPGSGLQ
jgi:hypothetical protein